MSTAVLAICVVLGVLLVLLGLALAAAARRGDALRRTDTRFRP
jgi:hypothetical protein